jgi:hypothetical protein
LYLPVLLTSGGNSGLSLSPHAAMPAVGKDATMAAHPQREGYPMIDDKTRDIIAAILTIPVAQKRLETIRVDKYEGQGMKDIIDYFFALKKTLKREYDEGR